MIWPNRVFWRVQGVKQTDKNDTRQTWISITGLEENAPYELVVKAGNRDGTSTLTQPVSFTLSDKYIISASTQSSTRTNSAFSFFILKTFYLIRQFKFGSRCGSCGCHHSNNLRFGRNNLLLAQEKHHWHQIVRRNAI